MDADGKATNTGGIRTPSNNGTDEMVINISGQEKAAKNSDPDAPKDLKAIVDSPQRVSIDLHLDVPKLVPIICPSPEMARLSPGPKKSPKIHKTETLNHQKSLARSVYSKPRSRFGEQCIPFDPNTFVEQVEQTASPDRASPRIKLGSYSYTTLKETIRTVSITSNTNVMLMPGGVVDEDRDDEAIYKKVSNRNTLKCKRLKMKVWIEWVVFFGLVGCLVASMIVYEKTQWMIWGLATWKWVMLVLATFSGMFITKWLIHTVVFLIELNFLFQKKVLYFVYGLKRTVQVCIWLSMVLVTWVLLLKELGEKRSPTEKLLDYITRTIVTLLVGSFLWLLKTLLLKIFASSFHVHTFFDRIQESIFHQYTLQTMSGPPVMESAGMLGRINTINSRFTSIRRKKGKKKMMQEVIDINKLHKLKLEKVSAWTMKMLIDLITSSGLSKISSALDESYDGAQTDNEITNEEEAIAAAYHIFRNVARPLSKYIDELDLRRFMTIEEVDLAFPMIDVAQSGSIDRKAMTDWVLKAYKGRKALAHALNDTKTALKQLNKLVEGILIVVTLILWLLLLEIATTKVVLFLSSQLLVAAFMFGNTCKTVFEAIIFVFVMHPFDVGDRCVVDGFQMIVEEMNILTTVFLKFDNEKVYYPNAVLATKPISNFYRSPDMGDSLEFSVDSTTTVEKIEALKGKIKEYFEKNPQHWHPNHNIVVKEIENVKQIKMVLFLNHTMNFQDYVEKNKRRSELVMELKKFFEDIGTKGDITTQDIYLGELGKGKFGR